MKIKLALAILLAIPGAAAAQDRLADQLRKAIVEEEVNQKLDKAIEAYTKILAQYEADRKVAATALFHFAECYRKLGRKDQAITAYERVLRDFADQMQLAEASRNQLTNAFGVSTGQEQAAVSKRQQELLQQEIALVQTQLHAAQRKVEAGIAGGWDETIALRKELLELEIRMEAYRKGSIEQFLQEELKLVQTQIQGAEARVKIGTLSPNGSELMALKKALLELQMRLDAVRKDAVPAPAGGQIAPLYVPEVDQQKKLIKKVEPLYPESARNVPVRGPVILEVVANENGDVVDVKIVGGGNPVVQKPVYEAVKQWRYSPTYVSGKAVPTKFTVTVPVEMKK